MRKRISPILILTICVLLYIMIFFFFSCMRALASSYGDADLGLFGQSFYTTLFCGDLFYNTYEDGSHFKMHNSPIFFLILPFYALHPGLYTLLFIMTCALAAGAYPVYLIARERLSERAGLIFGILYLMYHPLHGVNFCQFHELAFTITPLLFSYYFFLKRRFVPFWCCILLAMLCKEEISITTAAYGLYLVCYGLLLERRSLDERERRRIALNGAALILFSFLYLYLSLDVIIPFFKGSGYSYVSGRYGAYGRSLPGVILNLALHPALIFQAFWSDVARVHYVIELFLPLAFLSLWEMPVAAITIPNLFINIMSNYSTMYLTGSRYPSVLIPFIFISAILGAEKLSKRNTTKPEEKLRSLLRIPLVLTILCMFLINPSPMRIYVEKSFPWIDFKYPRISKHQEKILTLCREFPRGASIATQAGIYHHLCNGKYVYCGYHQGVDYLFVDTSSRWFAEHSHWNRDLPALIGSGEYEPCFEEDYIAIYKRKGLGANVVFTTGGRR